MDLIKDVVGSSQVQQTPEEGQRTYQPKRCGNNKEDEDNSPKTLNDKNHQASSQKFRQLIIRQVSFKIVTVSPMFVFSSPVSHFV